MRAKILLLVVVVLAANCLQQSEAASCVAVQDGDTFELDTSELVRLAGIDAPEHSEPGGASARDYLSGLILNKKIILVAGSEDKDNYGRLLRYVYVGDICVNEEMVRAGYAEVRYLPERDPNCEYYIQLEMEAEHKKAGLWAQGLFQPRLDLNWEGTIPVIDWKDAHAYYGQWVIVEGTIVDTYNAGKICYLNFHAEEEYFTAVIFACDFLLFPEPPDLFFRGKKVQIIGIVRKYRGRPEIIVKTPDQIRIIE